MNNTCEIEFYDGMSFGDISIDFTCDSIYIDKSSVGKNEKERKDYNLLAVGRSNKVAKQLIANLANNGFFLTTHSNGISLFKKLKDHDSFANLFTDKDIEVWNKTFFTLEKPEHLSEENRMVVVFSSIADFPLNASISRRMFFTNFQSIGKYIPKNTFILRIADLGGVLGSFYLNSNFDPHFEDKVQKLIMKIKSENNISNKHTVLYGVSKGATGALYHGIKMGLKTVAVDPIVSDSYYLEEHNDLHFVQDVFPRSKEEVFTELLKSNINKDMNNIKLVTSKNSEQYLYLNNIIISKNNSINTFIFDNPSIKTHSHVGGNTVNFVTSALNFLLYNTNINSDLVTTY